MKGIAVSSLMPVSQTTIARQIRSVAAELERLGEPERIGDIQVDRPVFTDIYGWMRAVYAPEVLQ